MLLGIIAKELNLPYMLVSGARPRDYFEWRAAGLALFRLRLILAGMEEEGADQIIYEILGDKEKVQRIRANAAADKLRRERGFSHGH